MSKLGYVLGLLSIPCILTAGTVACLTYIKEWNEPSFKKSEAVTNESLSPAVSDISEPPSIEMLQIPDIEESTEVIEDETIDDIPSEEVMDETNDYALDTNSESESLDTNEYQPSEEFYNDVSYEEDIEPADFTGVMNSLDDYMADELSEGIANYFLNDPNYEFESKQYKIGQTHEAPSKYTVRLDEVKKDGSDCQIIYTYTNLGYNNSDNGFSITDEQVTAESALESGENYYSDSDKRPRDIKKGESYTASVHSRLQNVESVTFTLSYKLPNGKYKCQIIEFVL